MANSRRSSPGGRRVSLLPIVDRELRRAVVPGDRLLVGLSGGLDSVVLLDILHRLASRRRIRLSALHVNHQLSPNARVWERFCRRACRDRSIPFRSKRVHVSRGDSLEAAARSARYAALLSQPVDHVVLAHHQDDQAETVLLQLLRGAGVKGLAAMPTIRIEDRGSEFEGRARIKDRASTIRKKNRSKAERSPDAQSSILNPAIFRPLLDVTRAEILAYARARGLKWVEDESNQDTRLARNLVRHELLPVLAERFPSYRVTLARSARHLGEAAQLLDELAAIDGMGAVCDGVLSVAVLLEISPPRARNLLRWFLQRRGAAAPSADRLDEILRQVTTAKEDARIKVELADHHLYRWRGGLYLVRRRHPAVPVAREWHAECGIELPELCGVLHLEKGRGAGINLARLKGQSVVVRTRVGGERLQPDCRRPRRTLKNLLQESGIPPWERERMPLLFCGADLIWAPDVGVDCAYQASPHERSLRPVWRPLSRE